MLITVYIKFHLYCDIKTQIDLHKKFRYYIQIWKKVQLIKRAVLTYHTDPLPKPRLLVCLDLPTVNKPVLDQIPNQILDTISEECKEHNLAFEMFDYASSVELERHQYNNASVDDILDFASKGTEIAIKILTKLKKNNETWSSDEEFNKYIISQISK